MKARFLTGVNPKEASDTILDYCPKILYKNIDEIVNEQSLTDIYFDFVAGDKDFTKTLNEISKDFYNEFPPILILLGVCFEIKGEFGFMWLHNMLQ